MTDKERIEHIRIFLGLNKTEFAKTLGYTTPQSYTNYLRGSNNLSMKMVKALKEHDIRISIDWILAGQGQMLINESNSNSQNSVEPSKNNDLDNSSVIENAFLKSKIELLEKSLKDKEKLISILEKNQK